MVTICRIMFIISRIFFFKQKTAYEMRISDWSSDVCSSDLADLVLRLEIDALRVQTAVIDPRVDIEFSEALVRMIGPSLAPVVQQVGSVPVANLGATALLVPLPHRQHDVRDRQSVV